MNKERVFKILLGPHISEKASVIAELNNQVVFRVIPDATKPEIKTAVEQLFDVTVEGVQVVNVKPKRKRTRYGFGAQGGIRKAYVTLQKGQEIDFVSVEKG
jgi:large subunit ribosomal protein L23